GATPPNRLERGSADAHDTGVPVVQALSGGGSVDFAGLTENVAYELVVRGVMNVAVSGQQAQFFILPDLATSGGRNVDLKVYKNSSDVEGSDIAHPSGNDYGALIAWNDAGFNSNAVLSRTLLCYHTPTGLMTT